MSVFDLLFILVFLSTAVTLVIALISLLRRRREKALGILRALGACLAVYFFVVVAVDIAAPQRVSRMGQDQCFDEICFAAIDVKTTTELGPKAHATKAGGVFYLVTLRVHSRALRRPQTEAGANVSLIDSRGHAYPVSSEGQRAYEEEYGTTRPLVSRLLPGETIESVQVFDVPADSSDESLHIGHDGPGLFIIGDDESALHKPTIIRLKS